MKPSLYVLHRQPQYHGPAVRAGRRRRSKQQSIDQPLHFFLRELHIYFDRRLACQTRSDVVTQRLLCLAAFIKIDMIQDLSEQVPCVAWREIGWDRLYCDRPSGQLHDAEPERCKIPFDQLKRLRLCGRKIKRFRKQKILRLDLSIRLAFPELVEEDPFVRDVLIYQQHPFVVNGDDKTIVELSNGPDLMRRDVAHLRASHKTLRRIYRRQIDRLGARFRFPPDVLVWFRRLTSGSEEFKFSGDTPGDDLFRLGIGRWVFLHARNNRSRRILDDIAKYRGVLAS